MPRISWRLQLDGHKRTIKLRHDYLSGDCTISLDQRTVGRIKAAGRDSSGGVDYPFRIGEHECSLHIGAGWRGTSYKLTVDGTLAGPAHVSGSPMAVLRLCAVLGFGGLVGIALLLWLGGPDSAPTGLIPSFWRHALRWPLIVMMAIGLGQSVLLAVVIGGQALEKRLGLTDVSVDAWHAPLVYGEFCQHFRELYRLGEQHGLEIQGPGGELKYAVSLLGVWRGRMLLTLSDNQGFSVGMVSTKILWPLFVAAANQHVARENESGVSGHVVDARGKRHAVYLASPDGEKVDLGLVSALQKVIASGKEALHPSTQVWSEGGMLRLHRSVFLGIKDRAQTLAATLDWMARICEVMEQDGMAYRSDECGAARETGTERMALEDSVFRGPGPQ